MENGIKKNQIDLSIIIVSYNTKKLTEECIESIVENVKEITYEIIVVDNNSPDHSGTELKKLESKTNCLKVIASSTNLGFSKGNNLGINESSGRLLLFLNPDTVVYPKTIETMVRFMDDNSDAGAATCKLELPNGGIDEASHRGFPTPWNAFCHFSKLERFFPKSKLFAGYIQGWKDLNVVHEVDAIVGAFMIVSRKAGDEIGWWDEDYFFYGEDLDFCYKLHEKGYKIYYVPDVSILHYGGVSSGIKKKTKSITTANVETVKKAQDARFAAMKTFYTKHYINKYPKVINYFVFKGIDYMHLKNLPKK